MTYEEVINKIKGKIGLKAKCELETDQERQIVWKALEKQIPKKPIYKKAGFCMVNLKSGEETPIYMFYCPSCNSLLENGKEHHCLCGQALDFGEEK